MALKKVDSDGVVTLQHQTGSSGLASGTPLPAVEYKTVAEQSEDIRVWHSEIEDKQAEYDAAEAVRDAKIKDHILNSRKEQSFYRVSKNARLEPDSAGEIPGWSHGLNPDYRLLYTVNSNVNWADRSDDEKELLTALGYGGAKYITRPFNVWEAVLHKNKQSNYGLYLSFSRAVAMTEMCMSKLVAGDYQGYGMTNGIKKEWGLTGSNWSKSSMDHGIAHLCAYINSRMTSATSVIHFALPQLVTGHYPLDDKRLGIVAFLGTDDFNNFYS